MNTLYTSPRSTESPMDFEYTSRPSTKPAWAASSSSSTADEPHTPRKRPLADLNSPAPPFPAPHTPTFGRMPTGIPFMLSVPVPPQTPPPPAPWPAAHYAEIRDVDMAEASPPHAPSAPPASRKDTEGEEEQRDGGEKDGREGGEGRVVALGGLRRAYKRRQRERSRLAARVDDADASEAESEGDEEASALAPRTSNHYTLNLGGPAGARDTPYVLLGYLQFFFNLSLVLVFLYLLVQFILTVQRDVEHRIAEYSMDIVQEIAQCALHYKTNLCGTRPVPAMAHQCGLWETCMNRDPSKVGRARVGAELIAEVVNGFVEPISWKTLAFTLTSLSFLTVFVNSLLSLYRSRHAPHPAPAPPPPFPVAPVPAHLLGAPQAWGRPWAGELPPRRRKLESGAAQEIL